MNGVLQPTLQAIDWLILQFAMDALGNHSLQERIAESVELDEDHLLMERLKADDRSALDQIFEKWKRPMISFFHRSLNDYHLAEDLTLKVALKVYQSRERYKPRAKFSTWLFSIAHNLLKDEFRRRRSRPPNSSDIFNPEWDYPEIEDASHTGNIHLWEEWLQHALEQLPETEREAVLLITQQGLKPGEAAEIMKITPNHLRVILSKGRKQLRKLRESEQ